MGLFRFLRRSRKDRDVYRADGYGAPVPYDMARIRTDYYRLLKAADLWWPAPGARRPMRAPLFVVSVPEDGSLIVGRSVDGLRAGPWVRFFAGGFRERGVLTPDGAWHSLEGRLSFQKSVQRGASE